VSRSFSIGIFPSRAKRCGSLAIGELVFRHDALDLVRPDAVSEPSVRLDGHALNDRVNLRLLDFHTPLRALPAVKDSFVYLINMCHFSVSFGSLSCKLTRREDHTARPSRGLDAVRDAKNATTSSAYL
jgi:hypothetical protein